MSARILLASLLMVGALAPPSAKAEPRPYAKSRARLYAYAEDRAYALVARPGWLVDIVLEPGERLAANGAIAAGDTARWIIGDAVSGPPDAQRAHVLVKPVAVGLSTNLVINTDRRTYHLDLRSAASDADAVARISWRYPSLPVVLVAAPPASPPAEAEPARPVLNFGYKITGPRVAWRPLRVFDDGRRAYVEFAPGFAREALPPLFGLSPDGKTATLLNTHVEGDRLVVDGRLDRAELRLGLGRWARRVVIVREAGR